jgi:hypothetical protein
MEQLLTQYQGGFRVGWLTGSHPFAKLEASPEKLTLSISPFFFVPDREIYEFTQKQVVA